MNELELKEAIEHDEARKVVEKEADKKNDELPTDQVYLGGRVVQLEAWKGQAEHLFNLCLAELRGDTKAASVDRQLLVGRIESFLTQH